MNQQMQIKLEEKAVALMANRLEEYADITCKLDRIAGQPETLKEEAETLQKATAKLKRQIETAPDEMAGRLLDGGDLDLSVLDDHTVNVTQNETKVKALLRIASELRDSQTELASKRGVFEGLIRSDVNGLVEETAKQYLQQVTLSEEGVTLIWAILNACDGRLEIKLEALGADYEKIHAAVANAQRSVLKTAGILELVDSAPA